MKQFFTDLAIDWHESTLIEKVLFWFFVVFITGIFVYSC